MIELPEDHATMCLPSSFLCPHCGRERETQDIASLCVEFDEWLVGDGTPTENGTHVSCSQERDGDDHWAMPYTDLLPLTIRVHRWAAANVRIVESEATIRARLAAWNAGEPIREVK